MATKTPLLYHGPLARDVAINSVGEESRLLQDPIGDAGLKVSDARDIVTLSQNPGVGDKAPHLIVGPLCRATPEAADALLKTLEEVQKTPVQIILWCDYLNEVIPTIKSRVRSVWCPEDATWVPPESWMNDKANELKKSLFSEDYAKVIALCRESGKDWPHLVRALIPLLELALEEDAERVIPLWVRLREILGDRGSYLVAVNALIPDPGEGRNG